MIDALMDARIVSVLAGLLGLILGSFLNVCTLRWPEDESVVFPGSHCPKCGEAIRWYDNVPVLGYIRLGGRCRACRDPISLQYPLVELATGLVWAGMFSYAGLSWEALTPTGSAGVRRCAVDCRPRETSCPPGEHRA